MQGRHNEAPPPKERIEKPLRKQELTKGAITKEEYQEWKLNWPQTADDCGKFEPSKKWRKDNINNE